MPRQLPVFYKGKLGRYFRDLRENHGWSLRRAVLIAEQRRLPVTLGAVRWLEAGLTKNPEPELLRALSRLYGEPYRNIIQEVAKQVFLIDPHELVQEDVQPTSTGDFVALPLHSRPIAADQPLQIAPDPNRDSSLAFRQEFVKRFTRPVALKVGKKEAAMRPTIEPGDVVLIDQHVARRRHPSGGQIYAINLGPLTGNDGGTLQRLDRSGRTLILSSDNPDKSAYPTRAFEITGVSLSDVVVGEVVWFGRSVGSRKRR